MIYNAKHFNTTEGIDTISFLFRPCAVNKETWFLQGRTVCPFVTTRVKKTDYKTYYYCDIQAEALDMKKNIKEQIHDIFITYLFKQDYLNTSTLPTENKVLIYMVRNFSSIAKLVRLDFFFDFKKESIRRNTLIKSQAQEKLDKNNVIGNTVYSPPARSGVSKVTLYDRMDCLLTKNQILHETLKLMLYSERLEVRFTPENCLYMNINNLDANYYDIISKYFAPILARVLKKYLPTMGEIINDLEHPSFSTINSLIFMSTPIKSPEVIHKTPKNTTP